MIGNQILSGLVQQSGNDVCNNANGTITFTETYKGPWTTINDLPTSGGFDYGVSRASTVANEWDSIFPAPKPPNGNSWYLVQVTTSQLEAGDHGEIRLTWEMRKTEGQDVDPDAPDLSTVTVNWECAWQGESTNVLAYCSNGGVNVDPNRTNAYAGNILLWAEEENAMIKSANSFQYDGIEYKLNDAELSVGQLYSKDVNPVFHSPVVTKTSTRNIEQLSSIAITGIDTIQTIEDCPFKFDQDWKFILLGNDITYEQKSYYSKRLSADVTYYFLTDKQTWAGHKNPREEFYGNNAWKIGEL